MKIRTVLLIGAFQILTAAALMAGVTERSYRVSDDYVGVPRNMDDVWNQRTRPPIIYPDRTYRVEIGAARGAHELLTYKEAKTALKTCADGRGTAPPGCQIVQVIQQQDDKGWRPWTPPPGASPEPRSGG